LLLISILVGMHNNPENILTTEHSFEYVDISEKNNLMDSFDRNHSIYRCRFCNVNAAWFKLVYNSFRRLYPKFQSEKCWKLNIDQNNILSENIEGKRKAVSSIFQIGSESVKFYGKDRLHPFSFDSFSMCFNSQTDADILRFGVSIM